MKRILVTGAAGFLGSSLCSELLAKGHTVIGVDNFNSDLYPSRIKANNWSKLTCHPNFISIIGDFEQIDIRIIGELDICYNFAALPGLVATEDASRKYFETNVLGTEKFLNQLKYQKNLKVVHASTSSVYGANAVGGESETCSPISSYGISKLASEHLVKNFCEKNNFDLSILRFFSIYGPRQRPDMAIHKLIHSGLTGKTFDVYGGLESVRSNTFVLDAVEALIQFGSNQEIIGTFNIAGGERKSLEEWVYLVETQIGKGIKLNFVSPRDGDQRVTSGDTTLAKKAIGFEPRFLAVDGLKLQIKDIKENIEFYS